MKTLVNRSSVLVAAAIVLLAIVLLFKPFDRAYGDTTTSQGSTAGLFQTYTFFATSTVQTGFATSTTATSTSISPWTNSAGQIDRGYFVIAGAKHVTMYFTRGDTLGTGNTGSTLYRVQVSANANPTENDWQYYNTFVQNTATSTASWEVSTFTNAAGTSTTIGFMQNLGFYAVRCIVLETTDGDHQCRASADY